MTFEHFWVTRCCDFSKQMAPHFEQKMYPPDHSWTAYNHFLHKMNANRLHSKSQHFSTKNNKKSRNLWNFVFFLDFQLFYIKHILPQWAVSYTVYFSTNPTKRWEFPGFYYSQKIIFFRIFFKHFSTKCGEMDVLFRPLTIDICILTPQCHHLSDDSGP